MGSARGQLIGVFICTQFVYLLTILKHLEISGGWWLQYCTVLRRRALSKCVYKKTIESKEHIRLELEIIKI